MDEIDKEINKEINDLQAQLKDIPDYWKSDGKGGVVSIHAESNERPLITLPNYYNNSKGSLYHIAEQRGWGVRLFDLVKRLERGGKKDSLKQEIEKSIGVLQLWLSELNK